MKITTSGKYSYLIFLYIIGYISCTPHDPPFQILGVMAPKPLRIDAYAGHYFFIVVSYCSAVQTFLSNTQII